MQVGSYSKMKKNRTIFYIAVVTLPFLWSLISFVFVNGQTLFFWFQKYDLETGTYIFNGIENFKFVLEDMMQEVWMSTAIRNGIVGSLITFLFSQVGLLASYYVYKKYPTHGFFKVFLYYPQIVSFTVYCVIFKYFADQAYPTIMQSIFGKQVDGLFVNPNTQFPALIAFSVFMGLGGGVLVNTSIMANTSNDIIEAAQLDGANALQEFWHITIPAMYPTLVLSLMTMFTGVFTNQFGVFTFFGNFAGTNMYTINYYMYKQIVSARPEQYPIVATMGAIITLIVVPLTFITRHFLIKFGPKED